MAIDTIPRSAADATRFTSSTPHANTKPSSSATGTINAASSGIGSSSRPAPRRPSPIQPGGVHTPETLDERVRRLRAAHLAARQHDVSKMDKVINVSRRYLDVAHRFTVMGLIGFSGLALLVTVYATVDMMIYNRKRRSEFFTVQQQMQTDSLEAARLAYMTGRASEEQIALVEEATAKAKQSGIAMPALLGAPQSAAPPGGRPGTERTWGVGEALAENNLDGASDEGAGKKKTGLRNWLFGGLKQEDSVAAATGASDGLSFGEEESAASGQVRRVANAVEGQKDAYKEKARAAFDTERENQRSGGPLDHVGLGGETKKKPPTSGWW